MITEKKKLGNAGEELAAKYLMEKGYVLLGRNVQMSHHEVDIVMRDGNCLVFVEVKTRRSDWFVDPIRAVDDEKLWNLLEAAKMYKRDHPECYRMEFRIDVVCVVVDVYLARKKDIIATKNNIPFTDMYYYSKDLKEVKINEEKNSKSYYFNSNSNHFCNCSIFFLK